MNTPSDSAIAQAFRDIAEQTKDGRIRFYEACEMRDYVEERARELDAAQPAAAGELPEPYALDWPEEGLTKEPHAIAMWNAHMYDTGAEPLFTADQLRAAVAGAQDKLDRTLDAMDRLHARAVKAEAAVAELQETIDEGKRQWDQVAALIGAVGDDVDDVLAKAAPVAGEQQLAATYRLDAVDKLVTEALQSALSELLSSHVQNNMGRMGVLGVIAINRAESYVRDALEAAALANCTEGASSSAAHLGSGDGKEGS